MPTEMDQAFGKVLESHRDVPAATAMVSIRDPTFTVQRSSLDAQFFAEMANILSGEPMGEQNTKQKKPFVMVQRHLSTAMKDFLVTERLHPAARRAVVTASLSLFRNSCGVNVPSKLSKMAANVLLQALDTVREPLRGAVLGSEGFPESQVAAFFLDATRAEPPPPPIPAITVPTDVAVKVICAFGIGKAQQGAPVLEWGTPTVADCLRGSVRRVADRLRDEGQWTTMSELVEHMRTPRGVDECEGVLGVPLAEIIASAMLGEHWEPARRLVLTAAPGVPRQTLARAMIPAASDAEAYDIATSLIEDNNLVAEFPEYRVLQRKSWLKKKKRKLEAVVKKPGWKMAQQMLDRGSRNEHELRIWLVEYMQSLGNLPAAAELMDYFDLHGELPEMDPGLVEASARERAAAHLRLPINESRILLVDNLHTLHYAQHALIDPPRIVDRRGAPGVSCVGVDVESCPVTAMATLLQVATSTDVFLFDLDAVCGYGSRNGYGNANGNINGNTSGNANGSGNGSRPYSSRKAQTSSSPPPPRRDELARRFDSMIGHLFASPRIVKLGFSFDNDAATLRKTWPHVRGFRRVAAVLEVGELGESAFGRTTPSLSSTCEAWLGKPLDKTECASKWNLRPLTVDQVRYAALDAHCLVGIFEEMLLEKRGNMSGTGAGGKDWWWTQQLAHCGE